MFGVGEDRSDGLFGLHHIALFDVQLAEVGVHCAVVTVLHDHRIRTADHEATGYFPLIHCSRFCTGHGLQVDTFVIHDHLRVHGVLLFTEMPANHSFLHRPGQTSFVGLKTTGNQLLFLRQRGLGRFLRLLADHLVDLLVQLIHFLLFLVDLFGQIFLLTLELIEHILLLAFVAFEVLLLTLAGTKRSLLVVLIRLQQVVLDIDLRLCVLDALYLLLTVMRKLLQVPRTTGQLLKTVATQQKQQRRLLHACKMTLPYHGRVIVLVTLQNLLQRVAGHTELVHLLVQRHDLIVQRANQLFLVLDVLTQ